ncbi:MAG: hypothetical protein QXZ13_00410 [Candidatus Diapherotrites archaeon]
MRVVLFFLLILFFQFSFVLAESNFSINDFDFLFVDGVLNEQSILAINSEIGLMPAELLSLFDSKKINVFVSLDNGSTKTYHVVFVGKKVEKVFLGTKENADVELRTGESSLRKIFFSEKPLESLVNAFNSGEIKLIGISDQGKASSFTASIFSTFLGLFNGIANFFSSIFSFFS